MICSIKINSNAIPFLNAWSKKNQENYRKCESNSARSCRYIKPCYWGYTGAGVNNINAINEKAPVNSGSFRPRCACWWGRIKPRSLARHHPGPLNEPHTASSPILDGQLVQNGLLAPGVEWKGEKNMSSIYFLWDCKHFSGLINKTLAFAEMICLLSDEERGSACQDERSPRYFKGCAQDSATQLMLNWTPPEASASTTS